MFFYAEVLPVVRLMMSGCCPECLKVTRPLSKLIEKELKRPRVGCRSTGAEGDTGPETRQDGRRASSQPGSGPASLRAAGSSESYFEGY